MSKCSYQESTLKLLKWWKIMICGNIIAVTFCHEILDVCWLVLIQPKYICCILPNEFGFILSIIGSVMYQYHHHPAPLLVNNRCQNLEPKGVVVLLHTFRDKCPFYSKHSNFREFLQFSKSNSYPTTTLHPHPFLPGTPLQSLKPMAPPLIFYPFWSL